MEETLKIPILPLLQTIKKGLKCDLWKTKLTGIVCRAIRHLPHGLHQGKLRWWRAVLPNLVEWRLHASRSQACDWVNLRPHVD
jgi:hypothetical protein